MNDREIFLSLMQNSLSDMQDTIDSLYITCNSCTKNMLLSRLRKNISSLALLVMGLKNTAQEASAESGQPQSGGVITAAELARYNGKDGNPAYWAVNGTVYDVTTSAAWAAATHFGLTAGRI
jgi:hypothetical protein